MREGLSDKGEDDNTAVQVCEQSAENFEILIDEIWRRITVGPIDALGPQRLPSRWIGTREGTV
jgi:hypothetical protein